MNTVARKVLLFGGGGVLFFTLALFGMFSVQSPQKLSLPPFSEWTVYSGVTVKANGDWEIVVDGTDAPYLYQIQSPPIDVEFFQNVYQFSLPIEVMQGKVAVGVLNEGKETWLNAPKLLSHYSVKTMFNRQVSVVVANDDPGPSNPSRFTVRIPR
ncbi:MAG: hypothetical protein G3M78_07640 [Candidatus Nitrohelix vancouverensis]|uniref:Uncharacterized protein n=1 Tax=Candidatus Nitrohelix vancouverensis TaxID=2705534 RepID=A0A7T0G3D4_9BACT|nr:MAG: hypothetical protein G3M78_07640 [Candidatus Nitrohelix vancouverensis]